MEQEKICTKCEIPKPYSGFAKDKSRSDGLRAWCKDCARNHQQAYAAEHREHLTRQHADWVENNRDKAREQNKHSYQRNIEKRREYDRARFPLRRDACNAKRRAMNAADPEGNRAKQRAWRAAHPESVAASESRKKARLKERLATDPVFAAEHLAKKRLKGNAKNAFYRDQAFRAYGSKCYCCSESNPAFLTLDHKDEKGHLHLTSSGARCTGFALYLWAIRNNFPDTLQLACFNCNCARSMRGINGICPHQLAKSAPVAGLSDALLYL